jgi:hypothetical protein
MYAYQQVVCMSLMSQTNTRSHNTHVASKNTRTRSKDMMMYHDDTMLVSQRQLAVQ